MFLMLFNTIIEVIIELFTMDLTKKKRGKKQ